MKNELLATIEILKNNMEELERKIKLLPDEDNNPISSPVEIETLSNNQEEQEIANLRALLNNPEWVEAVPADLICNEKDHDDKIVRGRGIRDIFYSGYDYTNKKVLDFGTGYAHLTEAINEKNPALVVGYDIENNFQIDLTRQPKIKLTSSWEEVVKNAPYDLVIMYDVFDHLIDESPASVLMKIKDVMSDTSVIRMRCHPFISRHGGHVYNTINKSYIHLVFNERELKLLGHDMKNYPSKKIIYPMKMYRSAINESKLKIISENVVNEPAEQFFLNGEIAERIKANLQIPNLLIPQMGMQFVDYTLGK